MRVRAASRSPCCSPKRTSEGHPCRRLETPTRLAVAAVAASGAPSPSPRPLGLPTAPDGAEPKAPAAAQEASDPKTLRICAAKKQPPLSLEDGSGLENKIGVALAEAMQPQGAIRLERSSRRSISCGIISTRSCATSSSASTRAIRACDHRSPIIARGYVFVTRADSDLDIKSWSDPRVENLGHIAVPFGSPGGTLAEGQAANMKTTWPISIRW